MADADPITSQVLADARALCAVPAPPFAEAERARFTTELLAGAGVPSRRPHRRRRSAGRGGPPGAGGGRARAAAGLPPARENASSTDANAAHGRGIPAITVGVTTGGNAHRLDDYVDVAPISGGVRALEALAIELSA